jgi:prepilin-type N-terminal cleavage/methylation domain-containing protein
MRKVFPRKDLLREEGGFTLPEVLVAMVMMVTVMFALYAIFDMSLRVFSFGNDKVEAVEGARIGLERMEREIRAAYPKNKPGGEETILFEGTGPNKIVFGNDVDPPDRKIVPDEQITYEFDDDNNRLLRNNQSVVEDVSNLDFEYQTEQGADVAYSSAEIVHIELQVEVDGGNSGTVTQTLNTDVALRNRVE